MQTDISKEDKCLQEQILNDVIADAQAKLAKVEGWCQSPQSWYKSPNGRIVLVYKKELRIFYFNIYSVIDTLIHQYNLKSKYKFIYRKKNNHKKSHFTGFEQKNPSLEAIKYCDELLLNNTQEFGLVFKRQICRILHKVNSNNTLDYHKFASIQNDLIEHYKNLDNNTRIKATKKNLKKIIYFLKDITYSDYGDLH